MIFQFHILATLAQGMSPQYCLEKGLSEPKGCSDYNTENSNSNVNI
jgi:hypothetical protein